jgi:predicted nucleic acid-binding protein
MIILDTNVVSAMMRLHLEPAVASWLARQTQSQIQTTTPVIFEIRYGIEREPAGRRRRDMEVAIAELLTTTFRGQVMEFDAGSADAAGMIHARQRARGNNVEVADSMIAGVAAFHGASIATRNVADFGGLGIDVVNPWLPA